MTDDLVFFTQLQVAEILKNSPKTFETWRQKGTGPKFKKAGRRILYSKNELSEFMNKSYNSTSQY